MTCLGFSPSAVGAPIYGYPAPQSDLLILETGIGKLFATTPGATLFAQRNSPSPTAKPSPKETVPDFSDLNFSKEKPTPKPTTAAKTTKSFNLNSPLLWIGTGAVLLIIGGVGLFYVVRHPSDRTESVAEELPPDPESDRTDTPDIKANPFQSQTDKNAQNNGFSTISENTYPEQPAPHLQAETNRYSDDISSVWENKPAEELSHHSQIETNSYIGDTSSVLENKHTEELTAQPQLETNIYSSSISPVGENKPLEQSTTSPQTEALEIREPTRLPKINIIDELIKDLQNPDPTKRRKAIWELAQRGDSRAVQPLLEIMMDADSMQRSLILEALSQIGTRTLKPMNRALAMSLQDDNPEVRKNAIRDVTRIFDMMAQVSQLLRHAVDDPDEEVQQTARWALTQLSRIRGLSGVDNFSNRPNSKNPPEN
ncbi:HEAT repeat domain-containing protein [Planktothrix sp. FACHB-1355]|uniref:HEAT repeat domain-containing protein n=2 Tax=Cyanophyceae TaxID=3028117 RepID=A0A926VI89_9CYAN|nr:HEAT repeat domain-containing protein [Aerosakkonema funiforme FACHB-1375]MBD3560485.1 HEAT repeat domain-containing protein [Planktothrix sp. FACHB-1355]